MSSPKLEIRVLKSEANIRAVYDDWFKLADSLDSAGVTQYPQHVLSCFLAFEAIRNESKIVAVFRGNHICAVFPVRQVTRRLYGARVRVLEFLDFPVPVRDVLIDPRESADEVFNFLVDGMAGAIEGAWDFMCFRGVLETSVLVELAERYALSVKSHYDFSHKLDVSHAGYVQNVLKSKVRSNLRRNLKKLGARGTYEFRTIDSYPQLEAAFDAFLTTEAAGWKSVRGGKRAVALHADQTAFYRSLLQESARHGRSHIHLLSLDGEPIASDYCILTADACFSLKHGYDEQYSDIAPGNLLREYTVEYYEGNNVVNSIDLVSGMKWHLAWQPERRKVYEVRFYNKTLRARTLFGLSRLRRKYSKR